MPTDTSLGRQQFLNYAERQRLVDKRIAEILREAAQEAGRIMIRMPGEGIGAQVRKFQYANAIEAVEDVTDVMWDDVGEVIQRSFADVAGAATDGTEDLMDFLTSNLDDNLASNIVGGARNQAERVGARLANDIDISETVAKNKALTSGKLDQQINNGLALGKSAREIAGDVIKHIRPETPGGASFAAMRIGRTELNNAFHTAALTNYKNQPWISAVRWSLSGSHSRPDICEEYAEDDKYGLGGGVFPTMQAPFKPHPQCLCYVTPVTVSPQEFKDRLINGDYDDWMEDNGFEPMIDRTDFAKAPTDLTKFINKEQMIAERNAGQSWAQIAEKYGLGNPAAARRAWTQLTGTPHTTSVIPGKAGRTPGSKKTSTATPKAPEKAVKVETATKSTSVPKSLDDRMKGTNHQWKDSETVTGAQNRIKNMLQDHSKLQGSLRQIERNAVSLKGMDVEMANKTGKAVSEFLNRFPKTRMYELKVAKLGAGTNADATSNIMRIRLHPDKFSTSRVALSAQQRSKRSNWLAGDKDVSTIWHEMGHLRHYAANEFHFSDRVNSVLKSALHEHYPDVSASDMDLFFARRGKKDKWSNSGGSVMKHIKKDLSEYAMTNHMELVAESFSEVMTYGDRARPIAKRIVEALDRM